MAYHIEKGGDLVIDGFEKGIADSPYIGIANIRNFNIKYYEGVAYVSYMRKPCTITGATPGRPLFATQSPSGLIYWSDDIGNIFKQNGVNSNAFSALTGNPFGVGSSGLQWFKGYLIAFGGQISICGNGTGDGGIVSTNWDTSTSATGVWPVINATLTLNASINQGDTTATISTYNDAQLTARAFWNGPTGTYLANLAASNGQLVLVTLTQGSSAITFTPEANADKNSTVFVDVVGGFGTTGTSHPSLVSQNDGALYFGNGANVGVLEQTDTTLFNKVDFSSFNFQSSGLGIKSTDTVVALAELQENLVVGGNEQLYFWNRLTPQWQSFLPMYEQIDTIINILNNLFIFAGEKGNIYYSNGASLSPFKKMPDYIAGVIDPAWLWGGIMQHRQRLYFQALAINSFTGVPILSGIFSLGLNNAVTSTSPETVSALVMENQNSFGLVLVPQGNFSFTGGLSVGATSGTLSGSWSGQTGQYQVVFSDGEIRYSTLTNSSTAVTWTTALTSNVTSSFTVNAYPVSNGLLIDNNSIAINYDNYYNAWGTLGTSGIDYNDTTLYSNNEPVIESDLIPVGTSINPKTFLQIEFKLDQPLQSGDSISLYARNSLADTYQLVGTTTSSVLSNETPFATFNNLQKIQWLQVMVTASCNSSAVNSSFNRLREIRIR